MASGFGNNGGPGRCFPFWQEVLACYVTNTTADDDSGKKLCSPVLEDYYECLHHKKEATRTAAFQLAWAKREFASSRSKEPSAQEIRNLGLLDKEEESKKTLSQYGQ